jgi:ferredoxin
MGLNWICPVRAFQVCAVDEARCTECGFCRQVFVCPGPQTCIGCGACVAGCPNEARRLVPDDRPRRQVTLTVDGHPFTVQEGVTLKRALEGLGYAFDRGRACTRWSCRRRWDTLGRGVARLVDGALGRLT